MTTDLGELGGSVDGETRDELDIAFRYFGTAIRVHPDLTDAVVVELFRTVTTLDKTPERGLELVDLYVTTLVHPDDHGMFREVMRAERVNIADLTTLGGRLLETLTGRPFQRPSDSSDGPRATDTSSEDDVYSEALRLTGSRPDLQAAVVMAGRARSA